jgi:hypothetical protein
VIKLRFRDAHAAAHQSARSVGWELNMRFHWAIRGGLLVAFAFFILVSRDAIADGYGRSPKRSGSHESLVLEFVRPQLDVLRRIDPACVVKLVGDATERGNISGLDLSTEARPHCLLSSAESDQLREGEALRRDDPSNNTVAIVRVLPLKHEGVSLLRVDQNFGGALTLVRYVVVSVVLDRASRMLLLSRELLPASTASDAAAIEHSNARQY